jgi:hypothetical protein
MNGFQNGLKEWAHAARVRQQGRVLPEVEVSIQVIGTRHRRAPAWGEACTSKIIQY